MSGGFVFLHFIANLLAILSVGFYFHSAKMACLYANVPKSSMAVSLINRIFFLKVLVIITMFSGKCETSLCALFHQQWFS